jgi:GT2 family glycosyltransferase
VWPEESDGLAQQGSWPPLAVVVVNWNGRHVLGDCLGSLQESRYDPLHILVVDNASSDGSTEWLRAAYPAVEVLEAPVNLRWAGGNNLGLRRLQATGHEDAYVLLLNNDTIVPEGSLQRLVQALMEEPRAWAATPRICYAHDPARIWYDGGLVGRRSGWVRHAGIRRFAGRRPVTPRFVDYGTGCALLLSPRALQQVGEFDEGFHFYAEDTDYSLRLRAAGGHILHVPRALVLHKVSSALGGGSPRKAYLKSRSHVRLLRRHWPRRRLPGLLPSQAVYYVGLAAWHLWRGRPETARQALQGVIDELCGISL